MAGWSWGVVPLLALWPCTPVRTPSAWWEVRIGPALATEPGRGKSPLAAVSLCEHVMLLKCEF